MGARRYGISLREFNSIAHKWDVELNTRREISYLQVTRYYFVYHVNTIAFYWQEKSTLLMNENKRIDKSPNTNRRVRWRTQDENMRWITTKTNNGPNFQYTKFSVIELVLTDRRNHSGTRPKSACGKSSSGRFSFSAARNAITKTTKYVTFGFSFRFFFGFLPFLGKFERHFL